MLVSDSFVRKARGVLAKGGGAGSQSYTVQYQAGLGERRRSPCDKSVKLQNDLETVM